MLFRQLEYFVAVAQERHFARAAEKCYVSQPALSAAIAKLERELNVTLINRGHSFEGLTPEGERLVVWAKRILAEHDAFKAEVHAVRSGITGTLRLGTVPTASTTASLVLSAFCSAHPLAKVQIRSRLAATELYRRLREFELDAVIVHATPDDAHDVDLVPLYEEHYVLLSSADMLPVRRIDAARGRTPRSCRWRCSPPTCATARSSTRPSPATTSPSPRRSKPTPSLRYSRRSPPATGRASFRTPGCGRRRWAQRSARSRWSIPVLKAEIALATNSAGPGSPVARALTACATELALQRVLRRAAAGDHAPALIGGDTGVAALVGLRLARCPLSTPAAGSSSQSMIDGPFDAIASVSADCSSDGVVT